MKKITDIDLIDGHNNPCIEYNIIYKLYQTNKTLLYNNYMGYHEARNINFDFNNRENLRKNDLSVENVIIKCATSNIHDHVLLEENFIYVLNNIKKTKSFILIVEYPEISHAVCIHINVDDRRIFFYDSYGEVHHKLNSFFIRKLDKIINAKYKITIKNFKIQEDEKACMCFSYCTLNFLNKYGKSITEGLLIRMVENRKFRFNNMIKSGLVILSKYTYNEPLFFEIKKKKEDFVPYYKIVEIEKLIS